MKNVLIFVALPILIAVTLAYVWSQELGCHDRGGVLVRAAFGLACVNEVQP
jgi:hypothetical protein